MRILLIEDDAPIASVIQRGLRGARFTVDVEANGLRGLERAEQEGYGVIILDVMLPGLDGWSICSALRDRCISTPILMLTARDSYEDRVRGLDTGADDYLTKPFHFPELLARVQALARRNQTHKSRMIRIADLELDTTLGRATRGGRELPLSRREYALLEALAGNEGRVLSCQTLCDYLADHSAEAQERLPWDIESLRRKIDPGDESSFISVLGGVGYRLEAPLPVGIGKDWGRTRCAS
jgi:two-component system copper resistance phosphate regulon response regulator CusR